MGTKYSEAKSGYNGKTYFERLSIIKKLPKHEREGYFHDIPNSRGTRSNRTDKQPFTTRPIKGFIELNSKQKRRLYDYF